MSIRCMILAALLCVPLWSNATDEFRIFKTDGRPIEARVLHVDPSRGMVELELRSKARKNIKVSIFRKKDQNYIRDWFAVQEFMSSRFKIEPTKNLLDTKKEMMGKQKAIRRDSKHLCFDILINNSTGASIKGLKLEYNIFYEQEELGIGDNVLKERYVYGSKKLEELLPRNKEIAQTTLFVVYNQRLSGGYDEYAGGAPTNQSGKTKGIWIKLHLKTPSGLSATREVCFPKTTNSQNTWHASPAQSTTS